MLAMAASGGPKRSTPPGWAPAAVGSRQAATSAIAKLLVNMLVFMKTPQE
jgi:hypothetical protein